MPTYRNDSTSIYGLDISLLVAGSEFFKPGNTVQTRELLDDLADVVRTDDEPYAYVDGEVEAIEYIAQTTAAVEGEGVSPGDTGKLTFVADGTLAAGESIPIEVQTATGWVEVMNTDVNVELTAGENVISTDKPGIYRANKPATAAAVGVTVYR